MSAEELKKWFIGIVVILGAIAICYVVSRAVGIAIPAFFINILWIVAVVIIAVVAIKFVMSLFKS